MSQQKKVKVAIAWANPYNKNLGVGALAYSALSLVSDVLEEARIESDITFFGTSKVASDVISIGNKTISFKSIYGMDFYTLKSVVKLILFPRRFNTKNILSYDYVLDIGEGDSFTDIYGNERFRRILNSKRFFSWLGKSVTLLPQTIGPFKDKKHEIDAFKTMANLNLIISRDKQSYDYTAKFLPKNKIQESIDVAFYMPFELSRYSTDKIHVGVNISGLLWNGGYTRNNQFNMKTDYKKLIRDTLRYFSDMNDVQVHLVPHVVSVNHPVEDDYAVSEEIKKEFPNVLLFPRFEDPIKAKGYISGLDFFTGARMHSCIAAFATGVAVYPMAYSRKFNGLFTDTLKYNWMGDCVNDNEEEVMKGLKIAFESRGELKIAIGESLTTIVKPRLIQLKKTLSDIFKR